LQRAQGGFPAGRRQGHEIDVVHLGARAANGAGNLDAFAVREQDAANPFSKGECVDEFHASLHGPRYEVRDGFPLTRVVLV
jgi:hypothetical protein